MSASKPSNRTERETDPRTRLEVDITETSAMEVREFANQRREPVHLERRGGRTFLITDTR